MSILARNLERLGLSFAAFSEGMRDRGEACALAVAVVTLGVVCGWLIGHLG